MGGPGSGRRPSIFGKKEEQTHVPTITGGFNIPNLSAVKDADDTVFSNKGFRMKGTISGAGVIHNLADGTFSFGHSDATGGGGAGGLWTSGATYHYPYDTSKGVSGAFFTSGATSLHYTSSQVDHDATTNYVAAEHVNASAFSVSGAVLTEVDPQWNAQSGAYMQTSVSGAWNTDLTSGASHFGNTSNPHQVSGSDINHDHLVGFVANEHLPASTFSVSGAVLSLSGSGASVIYGSIPNLTVGSASGGGSGTMTTVQVDDVQVGGADIVTLNFSGSDFNVTENPNTQINIEFSGARWAEKQDVVGVYSHSFADYENGLNDIGGLGGAPWQREIGSSFGSGATLYALGSPGALTSGAGYFQIPVPKDFDTSTHSYKIRIRARESTSPNVSSKIDLKVYADDGGGSDLVTTGIQTLTTSYANYDFTLTDTAIAEGEYLHTNLLAHVNDIGGSTEGRIDVIRISSVIA